MEFFFYLQNINCNLFKLHILFLNLLLEFLKYDCIEWQKLKIKPGRFDFGMYSSIFFCFVLIWTYIDVLFVEIFLFKIHMRKYVFFYLAKPYHDTWLNFFPNRPHVLVLWTRNWYLASRVFFFTKAKRILLSAIGKHTRWNFLIITFH
jgi:hypothetical protein